MTSDRLELNDAERTPCEVWTRVMGYHRPVSAFNPGKRSEHAERCQFVEQAPMGHAASHRSNRHTPAQHTAAA